MKALLALSFIAVLASVSFVSVPAPAQGPCVDTCVQKKRDLKGSCGAMCIVKCQHNCGPYGKKAKAKAKKSKAKKGY